MIQKKIATILFSVLLGSAHAQAVAPSIRLEKEGNTARLLIDDKPFLVLGGELGNSSASSMEYMRPYWQQLRQMHLNTVIAPVYWELMEPREGKFDFALVDSLLEVASRYELKLVLLWFGTWKNSMSCYAPAWMKTNPARFPRTADAEGRSQEIFSVFGKETLDADKKAFAALMRHIKEVDAAKKRVIMVQVENEMGMLSTAREVSIKANMLYKEKIPDLLAATLKKGAIVPELRKKWEASGARTEGSWEQVFGSDIYTEELFQAWYYARYVNEVANAGKAAYNLPMFVNAALRPPGILPGRFPSAGPLPHLMDLWQTAAPAIDLLSPDFYNPNTKYWCDLYTQNGNPLFIPEMLFDRAASAKVFLAVGRYKAFGFSPFSIESHQEGAAALTRSYAVLTQLMPVINTPKPPAMEGFFLDHLYRNDTLQMGSYTIYVSHFNTFPWAAGRMDSSWHAGGGIIIRTGEDEFYVAGTGFAAVFKNNDPEKVTNILSVDEVTIVDGKEVKGRRMNGDEDHQGRHVRFATDDWGIQKVKLYNSHR